MRMKGKGSSARVTVRRIAAHGVGVERTFFLASPRLEKIEVVRHAHVRRKQLYYLRQRRGKAARLRAKRYVRPEAEQAASPEGDQGKEQE
jgi:large subunit ribosomal protein L19